jgi:hypothetical protein
VLPSPTPISVFLPSPSTPTCTHASFSLSIIYHFTYLAFLQFFKPLEIRHKLRLPTYLTCFFLVFSWLEFIHRLFSIISSTFHRVFCNFWQGVSFNFSDLDLHSSNNNYKTRTSPMGSPASLDSTDGRRSLRRLMLPRICSLRRVGAMVALPTFHLDCLQCFWASPANPAAKRPPLGGAWTSRAVTDGSHSFSINKTFAIFAFLVCLFYWASLLSPFPPVYPYFGVRVLVTRYTCEITFNGDPGFVALVPQTKRSAPSEALPPHTFIHRLNFGLSKPSYVCTFNFLL